VAASFPLVAPWGAPEGSPLIPRHFIPLLIGLLGFAVAQAATESPRDDGLAPSPHDVQCVQGKIGLSEPGRAESAAGADACLLSSFGDRAAAERFARKKLGGLGAPCRCN
jgi:hypothetical protein